MKLIGGKKLQQLGSDRFTDDIDMMVFEPENPELFIRKPGLDIVNASAHPFYTAVWNLDADSEDVSLRALFEMAVFTFTNHCENGNWDKADAKEHDIKFLARKLNGNVNFEIARNYISAGAINEVKKILANIRY
jgi:hypothetical protein